MFVDKIPKVKVKSILLKEIVYNDIINWGTIQSTFILRTGNWKEKYSNIPGQLRTISVARQTGNILTNVLSVIIDKSITLNNPLILFPNPLFVPSKQMDGRLESL